MEHRAGHAHTLGHRLRQPEVQDLRHAVLREKNVLGLQVAMDDAEIVCGGQTVRYLHGDPQQRFHRDRTVRGQLAQRPPLDEFHGEIRHTVGFADVVDGHHVRVRQRRRGSRLSLESPPRVGVGQTGGQNLERDGPGEPGIVRFVDFTHAARSDVRDDFVGTETGAGAEHGKVDYARSRTS